MTKFYYPQEKCCKCMPQFLLDFNRLCEELDKADMCYPCALCFDEGRVANKPREGEAAAFVTLANVCALDGETIHMQFAIFCKACLASKNPKEITKMTHLRFIRMFASIERQKYYTDAAYRASQNAVIRVITVPSSRNVACANPACGMREVNQTVPFLACARCKTSGKFVYYCRTACQIEHWKNGHRKECVKIVTEPLQTKEEDK